MDDVINHIELGLKTHYTPHHRMRIRDYILKDWKACRVKLPTYMKLVARFIAKDFPEVWLSKLSHQTMMNMLMKRTLPRYEFLTCLHYYLKKKYGDKIKLDSAESVELEHLGQSLASFGAVEEGTMQAGTYKLPEGELIVLELDNTLYSEIRLRKKYQSPEPFSDEVSETLSGVLVRQNDKLIGVVRDEDTRILQMLELKQHQLEREV